MSQSDSTFPILPQILADGAERYWQRFQTACEQQAVSEPAISEAMKSSLLRAFALSDFVAENLIKDPAWALQVIDGELQQPGPACYQQWLAPQLSQCGGDERQVQQVLRVARRQQMTLIAWRDLLHIAPIEQTLARLSQFADALVSQALAWAYQLLTTQFGTPMGRQSGQPQPMLVLGMGKLGGGELNFSSDIDLIFAFPENGETQGARRSLDNQQFFTKLGQKLINLLAQSTADGFVYRVDMRLRPFGDSGPLVMSFAALEDYYQEQGREWERYAMVKARILGPRGRYHQELEGLLRPFIYRRYIDFSAIDSLRQMKAMISREVRRRSQLSNIKLGAGGIREIEFIVQVWQLIRGGRMPELQSHGLLETLALLGEHGLLNAADSETLRRAYLFLRRSEQMIQAIGDQQTQMLPDGDVDQLRLAHVLGYASYAQYFDALILHTDAVHEVFASVIGEEEERKEEVDDCYIELWQHDFELGELEGILTECGVAESKSQRLAKLLRDFRLQCQQRSMGNRGRETLSKLMPGLLQRVVQGDSPELLFERVTQVLTKILTRTAYLELLLENPGTLDQLCRLCAASPWIAEQLSRFPILLDELIDPAHLYQPPSPTQYREELREFVLRIPEDDLEQQMEALRQFKQIQQLRIAASDIAGALPLMKVSDHLTALAEALMEQVVGMAWQQMTLRYGLPSGLADNSYAFAVVGYGKMGGIELGYGSDLDLVFLHQAPAGHTQGEKSLTNQQFYLKLGQRIIHLCATRTPSGVLYEIDMRLRPSGASGLMVSHIDAFADYQAKEAWTWEHQALVRSRVVYGDSQLADDFAQVRANVLQRSREQGTLAEDVAKMRAKMYGHLNKGNAELYDLKQDTGGIVDIEFLAQYLVLAYSQQYPALSVWSDNVRIFETLAEEGIVSAELSKQLIAAYCRLRDKNHRLALQQLPGLLPVDGWQALRQQVREAWLSYLPDYLTLSESN
ncbi:bifunctional [glutamate--ammonia ligase]-adenylyl-L-tyrosine phosphorylase/[glutamate--ammonia-ligase] adenylyltransferase [Corallincola holothuriorum]|uniref:Bifunctional glutamine synthetase adenylyltransferase/adenylyl-removing enzyme n=1 Tax=Corallincola holothuriorum TaxID=2282215 RepID=A0A368NNJ2_9GAMM|nr:bifunctional [glutamate--ammonia ligase]-adenylyl-L-tyrosine phosphorylase/[glutamate--ammonia-ligase] adenylyltransferase [Corallincola holothuriorum]RCU51736.1 bifunctional [glutamate--ammonia ligase]-adenylyl-L-tyrosine phosphorylase/[glutamate--ammonia-ligase] adenylyltransferase [Corallincola holothuriorum]